MNLTSPPTQQVPASLMSLFDEEIRPRIQAHAGDLLVEGLTADGELKVKFVAACTACPLKPVTLVGLVERLAIDGEMVKSVSCESVNLPQPTWARLRSTFLGKEGSDSSPLS